MTDPVMTDEQANAQIQAQGLTFEDAFEQTKNKIEMALKTVPLLVRQFTQYLAESKGKYLRARAVLTCAMDGADRISTDAVKFAAAVEILHLATLVHDDVIDDAETRRGIPTLQKKFGKKTAVVCGDFLLSLALSQLSEGFPRDKYLDLQVPNYLGRLCVGELSEYINNDNLDLTARKYLRIISGKTAALFEASFFGGCVTVEKDEQVTKIYRRLGHYVGMIFQLTDDCIDFEEGEEVAQKSVQSDYEQGVITLPLIYALRDPDVKKTAAGRKMTRREINQAVLKSGGLVSAKNIAKIYYDKAWAIIGKLELTETKRRGLEDILNKAFRIA